MGCLSSLLRKMKKNKIDNYNMLEKEEKRERRKKIVEYILKQIRKSEFPDRLSGFLLRCLHLHLPIYLLLMILYFPLIIANIVIVISILILIGYIYYGGCILTSVEKELCKGEESIEDIVYITIVDPFILLNNEKISNETRKGYTIIVQTSWIITMIFIYFTRIILETNIVELII
jgi:hypothetical protein